MIESEIYLMMRCDKCHNILTDDYGQIIKIKDEHFEYNRPYDDLYEIAKGKNWDCRDKCLCPACKLEV